MKILTDEAALRALMPNTLVTVPGEMSLYDKLTPTITDTQQWITLHFMPADMLEALCTGDEYPHARKALRTLIAAEALRRAVPALDVTLTPNGIATVGTETLVAASSARIDRLIRYLTATRDDAIRTLLDELPQVSGWLSTDQARYFGATLYTSPRYTDIIGGEYPSAWDRYTQLQPRILELENTLAESHISQVLMSALRYEAQRNTLDGRRSSLANRIRAQVCIAIQDGDFNPRRLDEMVDFIRRYPNIFPEWFASPQAEIFTPPLFRNEKKSSGYFF